MKRRVDAVAPTREAIEQSDPEVTAQPEIALVPGKAAEPGHDQQQHGIDQTLRRGKPGKNDYRLAFEEGPDKDDEVETRAVLRNELIEVHWRVFLGQPRCSGRPAADGAALSWPAGGIC